MAIAVLIAADGLIVGWYSTGADSAPGDARQNGEQGGVVGANKQAVVARGCWAGRSRPGRLMAGMKTRRD
jgi:hypothetical protein